jgi:xanthine dehydrogenase accessory factor
MVTVANPCLSGGTLEIFLEAVVPPTLIRVHGAAPVAQALRRLGSALGFDVEVSSDPRIPLAPDTGAFIVASHGRDEEAMLAAALRGAVPYVGLVASKRRAAMVLSALDVSEDERARVHTPAGLDIGARTAPEIALSILAEIVATRTQPASGVPSASTFQAGDPATLVGRAPAATQLNHPATEVRPDRGADALDPVCGMTVAVSPSSLRYEYEGQVYHFCGAGCRHAFAADPANYL